MQEKKLKIVFRVGLTVNCLLMLFLATKTLVAAICACMTGIINAACIGFSLFKIVKQKRKASELTID